MVKYRACYNCLHYEERGIAQIPFGFRADEIAPIESAQDPRYTNFAPRCLKGLNPSLAHAPCGMQAEREQGAFEPDAMAAFCDSYLWAPVTAGDKFRRMVRRKHDEDPRFSTAALPLKFVKFWEKGSSVRIKVEQGSDDWRHTETGYIAMSTGWTPVFVLVRSIKAKSSPVILTEDDRIVGIRDARRSRYIPYRGVP